MVSYGYRMDHPQTRPATAPPDLLLAIDGGGTGCRARLCDRAGQTLGEARAGPANACTDFDQALSNVLSASRGALEAAGLAVDAQLAPQAARIGAWIGLAGAGLGDLSGRMQAALPFGHCRVGTDRDIAVEGALGGQDGTVALLGTGSFFVSRQGGITRTIGGRGLVLGDEAGGAWLGRELLRRTIYALEGLVAPTPLSREIAARFDERPENISAFARSADPAAFARLAPEIFTAHARGDALAARILDEALHQIGLRLDVLAAHGGGALYLLGGLAPAYRELLPARWQALCRPPRGSALDGALALAQRDFPAP